MREEARPSLQSKKQKVGKAGYWHGKIYEPKSGQKTLQRGEKKVISEIKRGRTCACPRFTGFLVYCPK